MNTCDLRAGHFLTQEHSLNNCLRETYKYGKIPNIKAMGLVVLRNNVFEICCFKSNFDSLSYFFN